MEKILIIGGSSNMGLATAKLALQRAYEVIIAGRNAEKLELARASLSPEVEVCQVDLSQEEGNLAKLQQLGAIDHMVITVGAPGAATSIPDTEVPQAKIAFERFWMNYRSLQLAKKLLPAGGSITLISGSSSKTPLSGYGFWGTLHGSIEALARNAALELAPIRVNVVSPGGIGLSPDRQLLEHYGHPDDVGQMILSIIANPAITNTKIDVDSGERQGNWSGEDT